MPYFSLAMLPGGRRRALLTGTVAVVGLGPGDSDWMTPQSRRELAAATDLIGYRGYLDRVEVRDGQRRHPSDNTDEPARARLACSLADQGRAVAVVSSGDPGYSRWPPPFWRKPSSGRGAGPVIPAMTAAQAVASRVGAPLGHDYAVISLSDRLKPWDVIAARLTAAAAADLVLAIYNPASVTRTWQVGAMRELLLAHRDPGIPVVIGRNVSGPVSGPNEDVRVVKLADLNPAEIDMRCLLIVGSSQTRWYSVDSQDRCSPRAAIPRRAELPRQSRAATATERACGRIPQGRPGCLRKARQFAPRTRQSPESCGDRQPAAERPTGRGWAPCANPAKTYRCRRHRNACASAVRNRARQPSKNRSCTAPWVGHDGTP